MSDRQPPRRDPYRYQARVYDRVIDPLNRGIRDVALKFDPPDPAWRVLDIGCGTGTGLQRYADAGCSITGVDPSEAMVSIASHRLGPGADLRLASGAALPFENATFDLVTTSMVLHEIAEPDRGAVISEMVRVLSPGGHILVIDFRFGSLRGWKGPALKILINAIELVGGHFSGFRSFRAGGGLPGLAERSGLDLRTEKIVAGGNVGIYVAGDTGKRG